MAQRDICWKVKKKGPLALPTESKQAGAVCGDGLLFEHPVSAPVVVRQRNRHRDRLEVCKLAISSDLNEWANWPGLTQVGRLWCLRRRKAKTIVDTSYLITSLSPEQATPTQLLHLVLGHWGIENSLHWVQDVTFDEDRCQIRSESA